MKLLNRNKQTFSYQNYLGKSEIMDGTLHTGEYTESYASAVSVSGVITAGTGEATVKEFGVDAKYDKLIYLDTVMNMSEESLVTIGTKNYAVKSISKYPNTMVVGVRELE